MERIILKWLLKRERRRIEAAMPATAFTMTLSVRLECLQELIEQLEDGR